jgi:hypothetical protein
VRLEDHRQAPQVWRVAIVGAGDQIDLWISGGCGEFGVWRVRRLESGLSFSRKASVTKASLGERLLERQESRCAR